MRIPLRITTCLAAMLLVGCDWPSFTGFECALSDSGDCGTPPVGIPSPAPYMVGFPIAKLDTSAFATGGPARGLLRLGDTVTFYVISATNFPSDTLRNVSWSADKTTARISVRDDGGMTLVATALGPVLVYTGDLGAVWSACEITAGAYSCTSIGEIDVVP